MPKYGIHHIILKEALTELQVSGDADAAEAAESINNELPSAIIGAIGPDLFFWGPDYEAVDKLYTLYKNIQDVVDLYNKVVEPVRQIKDAVVEPVEDLVETLAPSTIDLIRRLLQEIKETASLFHSAIGTGLFAGVLSGANIITDAVGVGSLSHRFFNLFAPDLNAGEKKLYWFDMLHYRHTGKFAYNLVKNASNDQTKAYAFGYLSHIAADVTGHPFVNQIVGSPYRQNVHRHITAENYQDSWEYNRYYTGESINQTLFARLGLPSSLPPDIGDLLHSSFSNTYIDLDRIPSHPAVNGHYTREQIDKTYDVFYKVLKLMEGMGVERPEEPFSGVADILADALDNFSPPPSPPSSSSSMCSWEDVFSFGLTSNSRDCYGNFFEEVANWLEYLGDLIAWSLETLRNLVDLVMTLLLSLPITVLLALLYGIQLLCYQVYCSARRILVLNGYVCPEPSDLNDSVARNLITQAQSCAYNFKNFPSIGTPYHNNLVCPVSNAESPKTASSFYPHSIDVTPDSYIRSEPFNESALGMYARSALSPEHTRSLEKDNLSIGNATAYTVWMIKNAQIFKNDRLAEEPLQVLFTNWNLDADRGYGYHSWEGTVPEESPFHMDDEKYF